MVVAVGKETDRAWKNVVEIIDIETLRFSTNTEHDFAEIRYEYCASFRQ